MPLVSTSAGTITNPPPTPKSPESTPAASPATTMSTTAHREVIAQPPARVAAAGRARLVGRVGRTRRSHRRRLLGAAGGLAPHPRGDGEHQGREQQQEHAPRELGRRATARAGHRASRPRRRAARCVTSTSPVPEPLDGRRRGRCRRRRPARRRPPPGAPRPGRRPAAARRRSTRRRRSGRARAPTAAPEDRSAQREHVAPFLRPPGSTASGQHHRPSRRCRSRPRRPAPPRRTPTGRGRPGGRTQPSSTCRAARATRPRSAPAVRARRPSLAPDDGQPRLLPGQRARPRR